MKFDSPSATECGARLFDNLSSGFHQFRSHIQAHLLARTGNFPSRQRVFRNDALDNVR
jgi:hypothetical protein